MNDNSVSHSFCLIKHISNTTIALFLAFLSLSVLHYRKDFTNLKMECVAPPTPTRFRLSTSATEIVVEDSSPP
ncbi:hypothetical protein VNO77_20655 [Canavalia gladiata]|uniref:Uncharacterized protein n=1 Tax=Canavalia gladiata TaxID=3824 RepID=A0AAN9QJJ7_CANGL